ncbi:MAG: UDP-N-acetylmuramate--L-alanine ligase [Thermoanaerobaculia bacterium]|nr:UDP-N-acetylmuramate--L-alanine ligase [Thermoanaerobaculia bacterium]
MMFRRFTGLQTVHFIGIGGAGMSGIAEVLAEYDLEVQGSDLRASATTLRLESLGIRVFEGHSAEHLGEAGLVVVSSAVPPDNPELVEARRRGLTVVPRAEMLAELMRLKYGIAVAGTHGKTTTTSLVGTLLTEAGLDPTVIVGGRLRVSGTGARLGHSDYLVCEADEFDRSFLRLQPIVAVITSIDRDHLDTYADLDEIRDAFLTFARKVPFFGQVIVCRDDPGVQQILPELGDDHRFGGRRVVTYGLSEGADLAAAEIESTGAGNRFSVLHQGEPLGRIEVPIPGLHNAQNALAAVAVGRAMELDFDTIASGLESFSGVHRRFERLGSWRGAAVVDDYAHHPTEVAATLAAAREAFPGARVHAVLQPHLYSRTREMATEFGRALLAADTVWVTEVYGSREKPIAGVSGRLVSDAARASGHRQVEFCPDWAEIQRGLATSIRPGDVVLTLGAGDIYRLGDHLTSEEGERHAG